MVVRDCTGHAAFIKSALVTASCAYEAETRALEWAVKVASSLGWEKIIWSSGALKVVEEILSRNEPGG